MITVRDVFDALYTLDEQRQQLADSLRETDAHEPTDDEVEGLLQSSRIGASRAAPADSLEPTDFD